MEASAVIRELLDSTSSQEIIDVLISVNAKLDTHVIDINAADKEEIRRYLAFYAEVLKSKHLGKSSFEAQFMYIQEVMVIVAYIERKK